MKLPKQDFGILRTATQHSVVSSGQKDVAEGGGIHPSTAWCEEACRYRKSYLNEPDASFQACLARCRRN